MLRNAYEQDTQSHNFNFNSLSTPSSSIPPKRPLLTIPDDISTNNLSPPIDESTLLIAQLNCFNGKSVVENILADKRYAIILIQEPWVNPHMLDVMKHPAWHDITPYDYKAQTYNDKLRTSIYISKRVPSWLITTLPSKSPLLTAVEIATPQGIIPRIRVISLYNPPRQNTGLPVLQDWLTMHHDRKIATVIGMDANLHHQLWNPTGYHHTHPKSKDLIRICGSTGLKISSQKQIPTYYARSGRASTTIDLTWINYKLSRYKVTCRTTDENYGSDHQTLTTCIDLKNTPTPQTHNSATLANMGKASFHDDVEAQLLNLPDTFQNTDEIDAGVQQITDTITGAFLRQGKVVKTKNHRHKAWWDEKVLKQPIKERNRARRWMILSKTQEAKTCYREWDRYVKILISDTKRNHWRSFLAKAQGSLSFKAFKYTEPHGSNTIAPLY